MSRIPSNDFLILAHISIAFMQVAIQEVEESQEIHGS
jgi:hypothetical protein